MRKLATVAAAFAAGIFAAQYLLPVGWQLPAAGIALALLLAAALWKNEKRLRLMLLLGGLGFALAYNWAYAALVQAPAELLADRELPEVTLEVCDWPEASGFGAKVTARLRREGTRLVKVVYYGDETVLDLRPGDVLTGSVSLASAGRIRDKELTAFTAKGVFLLAYDRGGLTVERGGDPLRYLPLRLGRLAQDKLAQLYGGDANGFVRAILTGDRSALFPRALSDLSEAGLMHITAVSGMHCAFLLGLLQLLLGKHRRRLLAAIAVPVLLFYMVLVGCSPSVVRACIMLLFLLAGPLLNRESDGPTALSAALMVILLQNPFAAASVSLQLSFGAVAGLFWLTPRVYQGLLGKKKRGKGYHFIAASLSATCGALVFTVPLTAVYFNYLVLVAPLSNLLCLWAAGAIFSLGLASLFLGFLWLPLGALAAWPAGLLVDYFLAVARALATLPYHAVYFNNPYLKYWLAYAYAALGCWLLGRGEGRRRYVVAGTLVTASLAITVALGAARYGGALEAVAVDVGQGESVLLRAGKQTALMDCGSSNRYRSAGGETADLLATLGVGRLDYLLLSHYHADHANGQAELLARVKVGRLLLPDIADETGLREEVLSLAADYGIPVTYIRQRETLPLGDAALTLFPPLGSGGINEEGLCLLASREDFDLLVTGDMAAATERTLLETYDLPDLEVLLVGHHGSKASSSEELLAACLPEVAVISVGDNSYGHPTDQAVQRLVRAGAALYRTDLQGDIHITVN